MHLSFGRVILFVQHVNALRHFYVDNFQFKVLEEIPDEWVVLNSGICELALHKATPSNTAAGSTAESNVKLVFQTTEDLAGLRELLIRNNVSVMEIKSFEGFPYIHFDGKDPEGNVFQIMQRVN
ncbi:VOC family protein [Terrimonas sp. NA20]|uniref:VOC family protein n=1 Tax=Terrimonas ginsenosidimutans TaxID=2908004 RepID=A0ABS9KXY0_9BACT|nr:VOC family protein [Terrimonas ginsenosidimutans]MCG2617180.1 VOC family protein [Terrimonas ginsenosidimutans]